ncbi:Uncharacterised protein [Mycobacteroides abscessus]|nr:Uncharacterised protein [Mycobacteroides abscessus]
MSPLSSSNAASTSSLTAKESWVTRVTVSSLDVQEGSTGPTSRAPGGRDGPREQVIENPDFLHRC